MTHRGIEHALVQRHFYPNYEQNGL